MADEEPETTTDSLNDVYSRFPNNGPRQKLKWIINRLIRLTKSNAETIASLLNEPRNIDSAFICNVIKAIWTTDYDFKTAKQVEKDDRKKKESASAKSGELAASSFLPGDAIGNNEISLAIPNQPVTTTNSNEADELENNLAPQGEKSNLEDDSKSSKKDDLNLRLSSGNHDETRNTKTTPIEVTANRVHISSSNSSSTSSSSSNDGSNTPDGGTSDLSEDKNEATFSESEEEEALKLKTIKSTSTPNNEDKKVVNKIRTKALQPFIRSPYSPPKKRQRTCRAKNPNTKHLSRS